MMRGRRLSNNVFVFGSNLAGIHGKGAALYARKYYGAILGRGRGPQGRSYAIPTKDEKLRPRSLVEIKDDIDNFLRYAARYSELQFLITPVGCGLAGYRREQIRPLFGKPLENMIFTKEWDE